MLKLLEYFSGPTYTLFVHENRLGYMPCNATTPSGRTT